MTDQDNQAQAKEVQDTELSTGERIQKARKAHGLTAEQLVKLLAKVDQAAENDRGISLPTLYRYEKGEREPGAREIRLLCRALNVSADWLVLGEAWNSEQEEDSELASSLRSLIRQASNEERLQAIFSKTKSRNNWHQILLAEVKNEA